MKKKILSIILALTMVLGMVPLAGITVFAEPATLTGFAGGNGTAENPYQIATKAQFEMLADGSSFDDTYFVLTADIGSTEDTVTFIIGERVDAFNGHFDGNGHTVTLKIIADGIQDVGLFSVIGENGEVKNLTTAGSVNSGEMGENAAGVCGKNCGTIANCTNCAGTWSNNGSGGVCGKNEKGGIIVNCCNYGDTNAGGICSDNDGTIANCCNYYNNEDLSGICRGNYGTIVDCRNYAVVYSGICMSNIQGKGYIINCFDCGKCKYGVCDTDKGSIINCYYDNRSNGGNGTALSTAQMTAASGSTLSTGVANNKPLVDLLNEYAAANPTYGSYKLMNWTNTQGEYPVSAYPITVNGTVVTDGNKNDILNDGGSVKLTGYDSYGIAELTLTNANVTGAGTIISATCNLSIVAVGNNTLSSTGESPAISCTGTQYGKLKIMGEGNLTATSASGNAISVHKDCEFLSSGTVTATGGIYGIISWNGAVKASNAKGTVIAHGSDATNGAMKTSSFDMTSASPIAVIGSDKADATMADCSAARFEKDAKCFKVVSGGVDKVAKTVILRPTVAKIGDTGYLTLADAVKAVGANGTIILTADITEEITLSSEQTFTIDKNGFTFENFKAGTGFTVKTEDLGNNKIKVTVGDSLTMLIKQHLNDKTVDKGGLMGRQELMEDKVVSETVGRTIIGLTEEQLNSIDDNLLVIGCDENGKEIKIEVDCAYTYFYDLQADGSCQKIEAKNFTSGGKQIVAFVIIEKDQSSETISGYGYFRLYNGSAETESNFITDVLYVPNKEN